MTIFILEDELSKRWRESPRTTQRRRKAGKGPPYTRLNQRTVIYDLDRVVEYEATHTFQHQAAELTGYSSGPVRRNTTQSKRDRVAPGGIERPP